MTTILAFLLSSFMVLLPKVAREPVELSRRKCEEIPEQVCSACGSSHLIKNGSAHHGNNWLRVFSLRGNLSESSYLPRFQRLPLK